MLLQDEVKLKIKDSLDQLNSERLLEAFSKAQANYFFHHPTQELNPAQKAKSFVKIAFKGFIPTLRRGLRSEARINRHLKLLNDQNVKDILLKFLLDEGWHKNLHSLNYQLIHFITGIQVESDAKAEELIEMTMDLLGYKKPLRKSLDLLEISDNNNIFSL